MGAGDGSWRWEGSRALELIVRELGVGEGGSELEKGLGKICFSNYITKLADIPSVYLCNY